MEQVQLYLSQALEIAREGFTQVDAGLGLVIALIAAFMVSKPRDLFALSLFSTIAHVVIKRLAPVITGDGGLSMPDILHGYFWRSAGTLYVGYFILIGILYLVRKLVLRR